MFKSTHRIGFVVAESDVGPVLRHLLALVKAVQVLAPSDHDPQRPARYGLFASFEQVPSPAEVRVLEQAGAELPERVRAGLEAVWRGDGRSTEDAVERVLEAGALKRQAISRAKRSSRT